MSKKKKFLGLFAILFVAIFAVGCVFATACGKKNKEESEPEHVHEYSKLNHDDTYHWYECATDGVVDESTKVEHSCVETGDTADCGNDGVKTYTCECGYSYTENSKATGEHTYDKAVFDWVEDYSSATASLVCSVCGDAKYTGVSADVTSESDEYGTTYTAKATFEDGTAKEDTKYVPFETNPGSAANYTVEHTVDFDKEESYSFIPFTDTDGEGPDYVPVGTYPDGILSYTVNAENGSKKSKILAVEGNDGSTSVNTLATGGETNAKNGLYFALDLSGFVGQTVKIEASMTANKDADSIESQGRSIYVSKNTSNPYETDSANIYARATSMGKSLENPTNLVYETEISSNQTLYITWDNNICIYSITISLTGDVDPWADEEIEPPAEHTHTYEDATAQWTWVADENSTTGYTATAAIECTDGACPDANKGVLTASAEATVTGTTAATCTETGSVSLSATVTLNGAECKGTGSVVLAMTEHTYPTEDDEKYGEHVLWNWDGKNETTETVVLTVKCSVCGEAELINQDVSYESVTNNDGSTTLTASYTVPGTEVTYGDTFTVPVPEIAIENRVVAIPAGETISYQAQDAVAAAGFYNVDTLEVTFDGATNTFTLKGAASTMNETQAEAFWPGTARKGDAYVIIGIYSNVGETITWQSSDKEKSFAKTNYQDDLAVIVRITGISNTVAFTITDGEGNEIEFTVSFADVALPTNADSAESIQKMIDDAASTGAAVSIVLANGIEGTITVTGGANVTLDLAGYTITGDSALDGTKGTRYTIIVEEGATLTITDSTGDGSIKCTYEATGNEDSRLGAAVYVNGGDLVISGGTIESSSVGVLAEAGTVTMNGGEINSTYYTIYESRGDVTVTINDGVVTGVRGIFVGGDSYWGYDAASYGNVTTLNIYGGTISATYGSAISTLGYTNQNAAIINIYGGEILGRDWEYTDPSTGATATGGNMPAIYIPNGTLNVYGGTIKGTTALEVRGGKVTITGGTFICTLPEGGEPNTPEYKSSGATSCGYALALFPFDSTEQSRMKANDMISITTELYISGTAVFEGAIYSATAGDYTGTWEGKYPEDRIFSVTGGYFSADPSDYLGQGYKAALGADGCYEVYAVTVASVAFEKAAYELTGADLPDVIITLSDGTIITLEAYVAVTGYVDWAVEGDVILDFDENGTPVLTGTTGVATLYVTLENGLKAECMIYVADEVTSEDFIIGKWTEETSVEASLSLGTLGAVTVELGVSATLTVTISTAKLAIVITSVPDGLVGYLLNVAGISVESEWTIFANQSWVRAGSEYYIHVEDSGLEYDVFATLTEEKTLYIPFEGTLMMDDLPIEVVFEGTMYKDGYDYSASDEPAELPGVYVDFSDSTTYEWIDLITATYTKTSTDGGETTTTDTEYTTVVRGENNTPSTSLNGLLTVVGTNDPTSSDPMRVDTSKGYLTTAGSTQSAGRYFQINIGEEYVGKYLVIEVSFTTGSNTKERSIILSTNKSVKAALKNTGDLAEYVIAYASSSSTATGDMTTFSFSMYIEEATTLYLTFSDSLYIYTVDVRITDEIPEEEEIIPIAGTWTEEIEFTIKGEFKNLLYGLGFDYILDGLGNLLDYILKDEYTITANAVLVVDENGTFELTLSDYSCSDTTLGSVIVGLLESIFEGDLELIGTWDWTDDGGYVAHMSDDDLGEFDIPVSVTVVDDEDTFCLSADIKLTINGTEIDFVIDNQTATRAKD